MVRAEVTCRPVPVFKGRHGNTPVQNLTPHILKLPVDKGSQRFKPFLSGNRGLLRDFLILDRYGNHRGILSPGGGKIKTVIKMHYGFRLCVNQSVHSELF